MVSLQEIYCGPISEKMIELATTICERTIQYGNQPTNIPVALPPLSSFIRHLAKRSKMNAATFLTTLVYLQRLHLRLPKTARGLPCSVLRIFLASFIIATKYMNDSPLKNETWALYSCLFSCSEGILYMSFLRVNLMEKQLLFLLDYNLKIDNRELIELIQYCSAFPVPRVKIASKIPNNNGLQSPPYESFTSQSRLSISKPEYPHIATHSRSTYFPPSIITPITPMR